ncbi:MAG: thiamine pyrophosphate-binding protein [Alphaproteobacteria bacterium]|nr:thiamine pyrophosphate-binding protein [Alphaproteobacteria bacterium]
MSKGVSVGTVVASFLEACDVRTAFGVISIHNMPILDAIGSRNRLRFVPTRGEAGAVNMADAYARVSGRLGVAITSTGTAAGNAAGALVEAQTAGTPLLHITGQIDSPHLDRGKGFIHEARDQLTMLKAVSKAAFRISSAEAACSTLRRAAKIALTAPTGPVSIEIPIDIQGALAVGSVDLVPDLVDIQEPAEGALDRLAEELGGARRPLLWLGGGARGAAAAVARLVEIGFGVVTSTQGRGILPETDPMSLGAFTMHRPVEDFYQTCDAVLVVGSHLRSNETLKYGLKLPRPLYQVDVEPGAKDRAYPCDAFLQGDAHLVLSGLADRLEGRINVDPGFAADLSAARGAAENMVEAGLGPYVRIADGIRAAAGHDTIWVRDVTILNSSWGNRAPSLTDPRHGVHAVGGGIGQGLPMAIGASLAAEGQPTLALLGDGGLQLCLGELATAVQEQIDLVIVVMNSRGYGVIKNIQDAHFGGRHYYTDLLTPDFSQICHAIGMKHDRLESLERVEESLGGALNSKGPRMVEIDMAAIGDFAQPFAGPAVRIAERVGV